MEKFYEERGGGEFDEGEGGSAKRKGDDDLSDLMPWLREDASGEITFEIYFGIVRQWPAMTRKESR